jgi:hypothetical protein
VAKGKKKLTLMFVFSPELSRMIPPLTPILLKAKWEWVQKTSLRGSFFLGGFILIRSAFYG